MRSRRWLGLSLATGIFILCGCGNSGGIAKTPATLSYAVSSAVYTKGVAIAPDTPAVTGGTLAGYTVVPALPAGLLLSPQTGVISGTPSAIAAKNTYTVSASSANGTSSATLTISVNDQAPTGLTYAARTAAYTVAVPITPNVPANGGGTVDSYAVSPALPSGLNLSATTESSAASRPRRSPRRNTLLPPPTPAEAPRPL